MEKIVIDAEMLQGLGRDPEARGFQRRRPRRSTPSRASRPAGISSARPTPSRATRHAFYRPLVSDWSSFENWRDAGSRTATERAHDIWKETLDEFVPPPLDPAIREELEAYVAQAQGRDRAGRGVSRFIMNARMYAVTPDVEAAWRGLLGHVTEEAGVELDYCPIPRRSRWSTCGPGRTSVASSCAAIPSRSDWPT